MKNKIRSLIFTLGLRSLHAFTLIGLPITALRVLLSKPEVLNFTITMEELAKVFYICVVESRPLRCEIASGCETEVVLKEDSTQSPQYLILPHSHIEHIAEILCVLCDYVVIKIL